MNYAMHQRRRGERQGPVSMQLTRQYEVNVKKPIITIQCDEYYSEVIT